MERERQRAEKHLDGYTFRNRETQKEELKAVCVVNE